MQTSHLNKKFKKIYVTARIGLFLIFLSGAVLFSHIILFPTASFDFFFRTPNATKNTVISPRTTSFVLYNNGSISEKDGFVFDTSFIGDYHEASLLFQLESKSLNQAKGTVTARKSYKAFLYPEDGSLAFNEGALLKNSNDYYLVSAGKLRKFASTRIINEMAFNEKAFIETNKLALSLNPIGEDIYDSLAYPQGTLFKVADDYYQLQNKNTAAKFVSEKAFLSRYSGEQAVEKSENFLSKFQIHEDLIGFRDGTLLSAGISVYIVSGNKSYPVNNPVTFEAMGYKWENVIPASSEELGIYEKEKLFTMSSAHPAGTVFEDEKSGKLFYVTESGKKLVASKSVLDTYGKFKTIAVNIESLSSKITCQIRPVFRPLNLYGCKTDIDNIEKFKGNNFEFRFDAESAIEIKDLNVKFTQNINFANLKKSLSGLKQRVANNYITEEN